MNIPLNGRTCSSSESLNSENQQNLKPLNKEAPCTIVGSVSTNSCSTWTIDNFSLYYSDESAKIESPEFPGKDREKVWRLQLLPFGSYKENEPYVSLNLKLDSFVPGNENDVNYEISILNDQNKKVHKFTNRRIQFTNQLGAGGLCRFFISRRELAKDEKLLADDKLRIHCKTWCIHNSEPPCCHSNEKLSSIFWALRSERQFVDFIINVRGEQLHVHKAIMAIGSPVLATMIETNNSQMDVEDCDPEVFEKFVRFLYLGCLNGIKHSELELLALAEQFEVENLKNICEESIADNITVNNAVRVFMEAERNNALILKPLVMEFIKKHIKEIIDSDGWESLIKTPSLVTELIKAVSDARQSKE
ncbi:hypothetical protein GE061_003206 [Apolygus lucorum]|uniref:BTB domain-containing protein n=1 Tax=Apolygus lucorum TaxID=248454 RepID=A0A6A4J487_APOLU|nr:hypothetical protein GE061_003206 [Apolygus lucorum]